VVDKSAVRTVYEPIEPNQALCQWIGHLFDSIPEEVIAGSQLVIDDRHAKTKMVQQIRAEVSATLRRRGLMRRLRGARGLPAHREDGLQLADMIVGAAQDTWGGAGSTRLAPYYRVYVSALG
jgi:hypothetical protein